MSQNTDILKHLKKRPINPIQALNKFGCFRLASRINQLRGMGHNIITKLITRNGKTYAQYRLA